VQASKAEKAAQRASAGDLRRIEQLPGRLNFEVIPNLDNFQAAFVARRFGLSAAVAATVASLVFGEARQ
jgi:hypothetical protein